MFLPHLKHALLTLEDCSDHLPASTRADLALTLVETSRFPGMPWKRFAVEQAELTARGLEDRYLHACVAQSRCVLSRIAGNMDHAAGNLDSLSHIGRSGVAEKRMHSAIGQAAIQHSLNRIQVEDLSAAQKYLEDWSSLGQSPSLMETVVLFRRDMMLGRVLRYRGEFRESLTHLERARTTVSQCRGLVFDEDLRDFTCDLADTLRELEDPASAEHHLRAEISRRDHNRISSPAGSPLELSLAEALFAQGRFDEAERLCLEVRSRPGLLKFERLRLLITLAKISHVNSRHEDALSCWSDAKNAIGEFQMTNGRTTRIIVMSVCDVSRRLGHTSLVLQSLKEVAALDELATPGGVECWIAGLRHWSEHLRSSDL